MNKEFAPYELAVKLKELGFDEPCIRYYQVDTDTKSLQIPMDDAYWGYYSDPRNWNHFEFLPYKPFCKCVSAPLISQCFRYLRNKEYKFNIVSDSGVDTEGFYFFDIWYKGFFVFETDFIYKTYEEAEVACLTKLIEIVEQQNQK